VISSRLLAGELDRFCTILFADERGKPAKTAIKTSAEAVLILIVVGMGNTVT
jgi:hypothetical protein